MVRKKLGIAGLCLLLLCSCANIRTLVKTSLQESRCGSPNPIPEQGKKCLSDKGRMRTPLTRGLKR